MNFLYLWALPLLLDSFFLSISVSKRIPVANSYDPGPCKNETHGKYVLVKNRADEEKVVICVKDKEVYQWKSMDGSANTVGEFFNPGHDCSDILNNCQDAKDGFFWITAGLPNPKKVWCDMTTDGGGFTLIGKMNTSSTWLVPSNVIPVEPFGDPHWSSSLGEIPILDFRVQMAIKENFKTTVAHWSLRLQATRPLKNLLTTKDGCDKRSAGIGNIAHVKNLQTERVVTTTLRCSKFGLAHRPSAPYGWPKMNLCFTKPCPWGFAHLVSGDFNYRPDDYGAFSYSKTGTISGMENNATAFVGCDNGICCACYGPADGEEEYCGGHCQAINGGEVRKDIFTWFWVRSSLPKKLWKRCMDYEVKLGSGKSIWYKLVGHDVIPVQGRCTKDAVLFHDGIVVVPDSKTGQKVPAIDGLLKYRKDKQELYVRSNKTWNVLAKRKEIRKEVSAVDSKLKQVDQKLHVQNQTIDRNNLEIHSELKDVKEMLNMQNQTMNEKIRYLERKVIGLFNSTVIQAPQECKSYTLLDNQDRNVKYIGGPDTCDRSISGWHRFGGAAGTQLPTSCISRTDTDTAKCGTHAVSWLNGAHPNMNEGKVTRQVCFSWAGNCCIKSKNIEVINCGFFYVYNLVPLSGWCHRRYCGTNV